MVSPAQHAAAVRALSLSYQHLDPDVPVRLAKRTTNLFRPRAAAMGPGLDVSALTGVIDVDPVAGTVSFPGGIDFDPDVLHGDAVAAGPQQPVLVHQYRLEHSV